MRWEGAYRRYAGEYKCTQDFGGKNMKESDYLEFLAALK
jgi:hypothetical protein